MIILQNKDLLQKGSERACYDHPFDKSKLIKIVYNQKGKNNQNDQELYYYNFLNKQNIAYSNISICYGKIDTNLGEGLVFEKIIDYDGNISKTLRHYLVLNKFDNNKEETLFNDLKEYLFKYKIIFSDPTSVNVLCKRLSKDEYKLVIIDGLGSKRKDIKLFFSMYFLSYRKYKTCKQWEKFINNIKRVKEKIKLNQKL